MLNLMRFVAFMLCACVVAVWSPASAQEKTGSKPGFTLQPGTAKIVLMRPTVRVGEQSTGGLFEPNADWSTQSRENLAAAIRQVQGSLGNTVVDYVEPVGADTATISAYQSLFSVVAGSVIEFQFFPGNRLPIKKRKDAFEWTLGPEVAQLPGLEGADYALFVFTEDQFGSGGRKALQIVGLLAGVAVTSGVHKGYAGLVDLKTGDLVWLNADLAMGGDVRTPEGAEKRVTQLFEGFPGRPAVAAAAAQGK